jgi:signal transduction histidine kinase
MSLSYIEILVLTLINSGGIFLIIVLSANSLNDKLYRWLTITAISILGWVNFAYLGYIDTNPSMALTFYRLNGAFVCLFMYAEYMLYIESFLEIRKKVFKWLMLIINLVFSLLILFTDALLSGATWKGWGNEISFGPANDFFSLFFLLFNVILIVILIVKFFKFQSEERRKVLYFLIGTFLFILSNIAFNVLTPELLQTARYQHLGDYSAVLFLIFTAYAILRHKFMNVKIALTALLIGVIGTLITIDILALSHNLLEQGLKFGILVFFAIISVLLVRSVLAEIKQREELAKANKALKESQQRYMDLATEQKDIIDVMGHEIRTPLTAIVQEIKIHKKYTLPIEKELLHEAKDLPNLKKILPYLLDTVKTIDRASTHAVSLVTDMLETARLDKKRFELNYETFDLVDTVKSSVDLMEKTIDIDDGTVKYEVNFVKPEFADFPVEADKVRIGQAIYALISNSIKYRDPKKDNVVVNVSVEKKADAAIIKIKDNGLGIDKEDLPKLGKKFLRLNPKLSGNLKRPGGTGLGLFVVKGVLEHHGGELTIDSEGIGHGSTFTLHFPIKKQAQASEQAQVDQPA